MADYSTTANVVLTVNGNQAKKMLADLEKEAQELNKELKAALDDKDSKRAVSLDRKLRRVERQINDIKTATQKVSDVMKDLNGATPRELERALRSLRAQLKGLTESDPVRAKLVEDFRKVKEQLDRVNASLKTQQTTWQKFTGWVNNAKASILGIIGSLAGFIATAKNAVDAFAGMEQEMANVRKYTGMTTDEVVSLNEAFKNMDTRTSREDLNKLAQEAGRLGKTSVEDVLGFVRAADQVNVALDDLGDGATLTLSKLTGIFGDEQRLGTEKALLSVGSVINELSQNCKASAPYITDFTSRLGGVGAQAGMTVQQIMSFAAVLDSSQAPLEKSATALQQLIVKMLQDPAKYAQAAGIEVKSFTELVKTDMNHALITFLESLSKAGKMDTLAPLLDEMKEKGSGTVATLATLTEHIEEVKNQQLVANQAFEEGISITNEFNVQNSTVAASLDKSKKSIHELMVELGEKLVPIINLANTSARIGLEILNTTVGFIKNYGVQIAYLSSIIISYSIGVKAANNWTLIWSKTVQFFTSDIKKAGAAVKAFFITLKSNPIGMVVSAVTALAGALILMNDKARQARKEFNEWKKSLTDLSSQVEDSTKKEISQLNRLYKAATDETLSREKRLEAADKMQKLYPDVFSNMSTEDILLGRAKKAYDNLTESIKENARAKAAANRIEEIEGQKLDLQIENDNLDDQRERLIKERDQAQKNADFYRKKQDEEGLSIFNQYGKWAKAEEDKVDSLNKKIRENLDLQRLNNAKLQESDKAIDALSEKAGSSISGNNATDDNGDNGSNGDYSPGMSDKERKAALKKAQQAFKEGLKAIKAEEEKELNELYAKRATGQIDYLQYIDERKAIEAKFYDDSLKFYEDNLKAIKGYNVEDDKDYQALQLKKTETLQKYENQRISYSAERIKRQSQFEIQELQNEYNWKENKTVADEIALQEQILEIKVKYLQQQQDLYAKGTKEWEDLQLQIEKTVEDDRFNKEQIFLKAVNEMRKKYDQQSAKEKFEQQKQVLYWLYTQEKITLEEYRKLLKQMGIELEQELKKQKESLPGYGSSLKDINEKAAADFNDDKRKLDKALADGLIDEKEYDQFLQRAKNKMVSTFTEGIKNCGDEWVALFASMGETWYNFFDGLGKGDDIENLGKAMQTTTAVVTAAISTITQFVQAEMQIQTAAIEKRYDTEITRAEGNTYKVKKLEKQKEDEIAKLKDEANQKMFAMQVIQAVAQTATNALNAYGSAAAIPLVGHILAPIAAGIATASGMVQVALIKKQQQAAAAQGYSEGGFTPKGGKYEEVGVVHAGEWVASQKLVNNPKTRPIIEALDYAQRTNTIGSISSRDVSRSITAPMVLAHGGATSQPNIIVNIPEDSSSNKELNNTLEKLNKRLDEPFVTVNSVTGEEGYEQAKEKYNRLIKNKSPKSKRK